MIKLYMAAPSGNAHKATLMLSLLGLDHEPVPVNLPEKQQKTPEYLAMNPLGLVPTLDDDGVVIRDSQAILCYLARKYGDGSWLPDDPIGLGHVMEWLSYSANEMLHGCALARALILFNREGDLPAAQERARQSLAVLDAHLADRDWLVGDAPTVADVANYVYAGLVHQGDVDPLAYANVVKWFDRIEALPGYVGMAALPTPR